MYAPGYWIYRQYPVSGQAESPGTPAIGRVSVAPSEARRIPRGAPAGAVGGSRRGPSQLR